jgi:hypothetical protein
MIGKKIFGIFIVILFIFQITSAVLVSANKINPVIRNSIYNDETEYWGVSIIGFDDLYSVNNTPFIYDSLLESDNWDEQHLRLLYRENATRAAILDALDWIIENSDENDIVLFHDNSHGTKVDGEYGIVPVDSEINGIITVDELDEKFDNIECKSMCLIFDCCLAGSFVKRDISHYEELMMRGFFSTKAFTEGIEGDNRVILMATMRNGLGFGAQMTDENGTDIEISFSKFVAESFSSKIDENNDGYTSAEEAFKYAKEKWKPWGKMVFFMLKYQIQLFLQTGFFVIPFPTIHDGIEGELPIIVI